MIFLSFQRIVIPKAFTFANLNVFSSIGTVVINSPKNVMYLTNRSFGNGLQFPYNTLSQNRLQIHYINQMRMLSGMKGIQENISVLQMKKRPLRKKRPVVEDEERPLPGFWNVKAVATAEEYNLEELMDGLLEQNLYIPRKICTTSNYLYNPIISLEILRYDG